MTTEILTGKLSSSSGLTGPFLQPSLNCFKSFFFFFFFLGRSNKNVANTIISPVEFRLWKQRWLRKFRIYGKWCPGFKWTQWKVRLVSGRARKTKKCLVFSTPAPMWGMLIQRLECSSVVECMLSMYVWGPGLNSLVLKTNKHTTKTSKDL